MQHVLDVAARAFAERGFHMVSMDDIAAAAGVSKPVVYTHFESKDGLYEAVLERSSGELAERLRASVAAAATPEERMWAGILAFVDTVEEHPEWWLLARQAAIAGEPFAGMARRVSDEMGAVIAGLFTDAAEQAGIGGGVAAIEPLARAFVGACGAIADWWIAHPEVPAGTVAITLMNMLWMGFGDLVDTNLWLPPEAREP
jgi:AcrR family transcriptional regulator